MSETMSADISLFDLVNLSIGTPEVATVNLNALHTLLHAIVKHLQIQSVTTAWRDPDVGQETRTTLSTETFPREKLSSQHNIDSKMRQIESQLAALEQLPSGNELLNRTAAGIKAPVTDMWQLMQLRKKVEGSEDGVSKCMNLIQELMKQIHELKEARDNLKEEVEALEHQFHQTNVHQLTDRVIAMEQYFHQVESLENAVRELKEQMALYPKPEELTQCVTWEVMQATLINNRHQKKEEMKDSFTSTGPQAMLSQHDVPLTASDKADLHVLVNSSNTTDPKQGSTFGEALVQQGPSDEALLLLSSQPLSWISSGAQHYPETVQALRNLGYLQAKYENLEAHVERLEECKSDRTEVQQLFSSIGTEDVPEKVMEQVNYLKTLVDTVMTDKQKTSELMCSVQCSILQLQAECEKLQSGVNQLMDDNNKKQTRLDQLYRTMEELNEKKADKELVEMEMDIKADKLALNTKVSLTQFDTATEHLSGLFQELLGKITGQEQDWHKLSREMESKLNRIELDPLKKQLEDHWKSILKQLQAQAAPEHDDAAGFRKQLVARFRCLSCDRLVDMNTPGRHILTMPLAPGLPIHKSKIPYTIYDLDEVRQQSRSEHEKADDGYLAMSRSCGGSHTAVNSNRRCSRLRYFMHRNQPENNELDTPCSAIEIQPEDVDILGLDGQIYKGHISTKTLTTMEPRLPSISPKEGHCKGKSRTGRCQSQKGFIQEQSAKTRHNSTGSSTSVKERPTSSMGCLYHDSSPLCAADCNSELLQGQELHSNFCQSQDEPVTSP